MSTAMILTGAPGAGKTSVLDRLCTRLEVEGARFSAIESEQFSRGYPWLPLAELVPQLAAVVALQRQVGRFVFLVAATTETDEELDAVSEAINADEQLVVCLSAASHVVAGRVAEREPDDWPGRTALIDRAHALARDIPKLAGIDLVISTDRREVDEVVGEVRGALREHGIT